MAASDHLTLTGTTLPVVLFSFRLTSLVRQPFERMGAASYAEAQFKSADGKTRLYLGALTGFDYIRESGTVHFECRDIDSVVRQGRWCVEGLDAGPIPTDAPFRDATVVKDGIARVERLYVRNWLLKALYLRPIALTGEQNALPLSLDAILGPSGEILFLPRSAPVTNT